MNRRTCESVLADCHDAEGRGAMHRVSASAGLSAKGAGTKFEIALGVTMTVPECAGPRGPMPCSDE